MKLENAHLSRTFILENERFIEQAIYNKHLDSEVILTNEDVFKIETIQGSIIYSSQVPVISCSKTDLEIQVEFKDERIHINLVYQVRDQVIAKQLKILSASIPLFRIMVDTISFEDDKNLFYPRKQDPIKEMGGFDGHYVECGQPIYAKGMFWGMEFPMAENRMDHLTYTSTYYLGNDLQYPKVIWETIVGASRGYSFLEVQDSFYQYLESIAIPTYFRKQYNSWYDHMTDIDEKKILESFAEINQGFNTYDLQLDAFVVDDGWNDYESLWEFNEKFPNGLSKVKNLVNKLGSNLGLWVGPRGGYNGTEIVMSDWLQAHLDLCIGSKNPISHDVNIADIHYLKALKNRLLELQKRYDISYWKIDGWLLAPPEVSEKDPKGMVTMTWVYEQLIDLLSSLREASKVDKYWLNLTSYVNPSPWFLKYVNSLWIQTSQDIGFTEGAGDDLNRLLTYRDGQYYEFLFKRQIQLPLWSLYNHEPVYAATAHTWYMDHQMYIPVDKFADYLKFIATRGNGFWEFYYSYSMFDQERWQENAKAVKWIESRYSILKNSQYIGGNPLEGQVYGYQCCDDRGNWIVSLRNPSERVEKINVVDLDLNYFEEIIRDKGLFFENGYMYLQPYQLILLEQVT